MKDYFFFSRVLTILCNIIKFSVYAFFFQLVWRERGEESEEGRLYVTFLLLKMRL